MRTHPAMQQGGRVFFREDFLNVARVHDNHGQLVGSPSVSRGLTGGQVRFYVGGNDAAHAGSVTILCHAIVMTSGSDQSLWSIGSTAVRHMEVGIDATGKPYVWGTAQVLLGETIPDGRHDIGWSISAFGVVSCCVDGKLWGAGSVTFGLVVVDWIMAIGGSVLGTLQWAGVIEEVRVYRGILSHTSMSNEMGVSSVFAPTDLDWDVYCDSDVADVTGGAVDAWTDLSGKDNHPIGATTQRPTQLSGGPNGHKKIVFNGTSNILRAAYTAPSPRDRVFVANMGVPAAAYYIDGYTFETSLLTWDAGGGGLMYVWTPGANFSHAPPASGWHIHHIRYAGSESFWSVDGATPWASGTLTELASGGISIGAGNGGPGGPGVPAYFAAMDMAMIGDRSWLLSAYDRWRVISSLSDKYNIPIDTSFWSWV